MKKVIIAIMLSSILMCVTPAIATSSFHAADSSNEVTQPGTEVTTFATDEFGNRYIVYGISLNNGKIGVVATTASVSYYYGGTKEDREKVNDFEKTVTAYADVLLVGGGQNTIDKNKTAKGESVSVNGEKQFLYYINAILGKHTFSCQGAYASFSTRG